MRYQEHSAEHIRKSESDSRRLNFANLIQPLKNDMTFPVLHTHRSGSYNGFPVSYLNDRRKYLFVSRYIRS